jgi:hypothetical protein
LGCFEIKSSICNAAIEENEPVQDLFELNGTETGIGARAAATTQSTPQQTSEPKSSIGNM